MPLAGSMVATHAWLNRLDPAWLTGSEIIGLQLKCSLTFHQGLARYFSLSVMTACIARLEMSRPISMQDEQVIWHRQKSLGTAFSTRFLNIGPVDHGLSDHRYWILALSSARCRRHDQSVARRGSQQKESKCHYPSPYTPVYRS
jgi:hypothetical protein